MPHGNAAKTAPYLLDFPDTKMRSELHKETIDACVETKMDVSEYIVGILRKRDKIKVKSIMKLEGESRAPFFLRFRDKALRDAIKSEARERKVTMGELIVAILENRHQLRT
jgi:hypothetical protein